MSCWIVLAGWILSLGLTGCGDGEKNSMGPEETQRQESQDDDQPLRDLAIRMFTPRYPGAPEYETILLPGELPPALPFDLLLPASTTVIGSLVRQAVTGGAQIEVILDMGQSAQAVKDFFKERLAEQGFVAGDEMEGGGVFVPAPDLQVVTLAMCYEERDLVLWVNAFEMESRPTEVRLSIQTEAEYSPCAREDQGGIPESHSELMSVLPQLTAPPGARMLGGSSGTSSIAYPAFQQVYASTDLETELAPEALAGHFDPQIEQVGWQLVESGHTASAAWSTWTFTRDGSPWSGMLIILAYGSDPRFKFVLLRADRAE